MGAPDHQWEASQQDWDECFRLVGRFMFSWAALESEVNRFLTAAMRLGPTEGLIVCANMQFRDKMHIVTTALDEFGPKKDKDWTRQTKEIAKEIRGLSVDRNMVAHQFFAPDPKGVRFFVKKAKGKVSIPETVWSKDNFVDVSGRIYAAAHALTALQEKVARKIILGPSPTMGRGLFGSAFRTYEQEASTGALSPRSRGRSRILSALDSPAPSPQPSDETPPDNAEWDWLKPPPAPAPPEEE